MWLLITSWVPSVEPVATITHDRMEGATKADRGARDPQVAQSR